MVTYFVMEVTTAFYATGWKKHAFAENVVFLGSGITITAGKRLQTLLHLVYNLLDRRILQSSVNRNIYTYDLVRIKRIQRRIYTKWKGETNAVIRVNLSSQSGKGLRDFWAIAPSISCVMFAELRESTITSEASWKSGENISTADTTYSPVLAFVATLPPPNMKKSH